MKKKCIVGRERGLAYWDNKSRLISGKMNENNLWKKGYKKNCSW